MTLQEAFNKIWVHAQKKKKSAKWGTCAYHGAKGAKCFVGVLIPKKLYEPRFDAQRYTNAMDVEDVLRIVGLSHLEEGLVKLQGIHDSFPAEAWNGELRCFAEKNGLTVPTTGEKV